jgi:hypothetical protein
LPTCVPQQLGSYRGYTTVSGQGPRGAKMTPN